MASNAELLEELTTAKARIEDLERALDDELRYPRATTYTVDRILEDVEAERDFLRDVVRNLTTKDGTDAPRS